MVFIQYYGFLSKPAIFLRGLLYFLLYFVVLFNISTVYSVGGASYEMYVLRMYRKQSHRQPFDGRRQNDTPPSGVYAVRQAFHDI